MTCQNTLQFHLERFVDSFLVNDAKVRFLELARTPSGRRKFQKTLYKLADKIDRSYVKDLQSYSASEIRDYLLKERGLLSYTKVLIFDLGRSGEESYAKLEDVIESMCEGFDSIISILPGRLVYFASEHPRAIWLLERPCQSK